MAKEVIAIQSEDKMAVWKLENIFKIPDIWNKCIILDLCLFMFEKYTPVRAEARIKVLWYVCQSIT